MSNTPTLEQITSSNVVIVAGKGGVGKTTVTAVLARAAADSGRRVLVVELDGKPTLGKLVGDGVDLLQLDPSTALIDYLNEHGFGRMAKRFINSGAVEVVSTATPGLGEVVTLGKIKQIERSGEYDLIVVDGPAAGHAIGLLTSAAGLADAVRSGPIFRQATEVGEMLHDPERCSTVLVTVAETTPVNELIETAFLVEERAGVHLTAVVVNQLDPPLEQTEPTADGTNPRDAADRATRFASRRQQRQRDQLVRLDDELPLPRRTLPALPVAGLDTSDIAVLAEVVANADGDHRPAIDLAAYDDPGATQRFDAAMLAGPNPLPEVLDAADVVVCCGSGGVGKTTTAAAMAIEAAHRGRRAVVVTIDPARRLADALGLPGGLTDEPSLVPWSADLDGEVWAMMLDAAAMLATVVREQAADDEQAARIADNRFFVNLSQSLSGTQEYMASEALYRLRHDPRFDLVIVDTPPSRSAIDFLESPGVLTRFLGHPLFKLMMMPTRTGLKVVNSASQLILRRIGKIVGTDVLADAAAFFQAFAGMDVGFAERAEAVNELMRADTTYFVLVATPQHDTASEAAWFAEQLITAGYGVSAMVINRLAPYFCETPDATGRDRLVGTGGVTALAWFNRLAVAQRTTLDDMIGDVDVGAVVAVPLFASDVHDVDSLDAMRSALFELR